MTGQLNILDHSGDIKLIWDSAIPKDVDEARKAFDSAKAKGYMAYTVNDKDFTKGEVIREFDPNMQRIIMTPQMQGG